MKRKTPWILVSPAYLVIFAIGYAALVAYQWGILGSLRIGPSEEDLIFAHLYEIVLGAWMVTYAVARVWHFHPVTNRPYAAWLMSSPWTYRQRLPLGPLHLVWQDLLIVTPAFLLERYHAHSSGPLPIIVFLAVYIGATAAFQFVTKPHPLVLLLLAGLPVPLLLLDVANWQWWVLAALLLLYPAAAYATRASLRDFPWKIGTPRPESEIGNWLFARLGPLDLADLISVRNALIISLLVAWWVYCFAARLDFPAARADLIALRYLLIMAGGMVAIVRIASYCVYFRWPISIPGRIVTGRLIIPGYDRVFVAPLVIVAAAFFVSTLLLTGVPGPLVCALVAFFTLLPGLAMGPSLSRWKLTGFHHIANITPSSRASGARRSNRTWNT